MQIFLHNDRKNIASIGKKSKLLFFLLIIIIIVNFNSNSTTTSAITTQEDITIDIIIVKYSACDDCVKKYRDYIEPFYKKYQDYYNFTVIDAAYSFDVFVDEVDRLNISISSYGNFPWVIFVSSEDKILVVDDSGLPNLEQTFIDFIGSNPLTTIPTDQDFAIEILNLEELLLSLTIVGSFVGIFGVMALFYKTVINKFYPEQKLLLTRRIGRLRITFIISLTSISITALTYQFIDFLSGGCGCATNKMAVSLLFRQYETINLLGLAIPIALIGLGFMSVILIQILILATIPCPLTINLPKKSLFTLTEQHLRYFYFLIIGELLLGILSLFYLLYLELFVIHFICILCTISQIIIVLNTLLVITWKPFSNSQTSSMS